MTAFALSGTASGPRPSGLLDRLARDEPIMTALAIVLALVIVPLAAAAMIDPRLHLGIGIWIKPLKFAFALAVYCLTLAFYARFLPEGTVHKRWYRWFMAAVAAAIVAEMLWIGGAAALGTSSHFNTAEPVFAALYPVMGALALLLTSATAVHARQIAANPATGLAPVLKSGLVWGLGMTLPLTAVTAGLMSQFPGHGIGGSGLDTDGLFLIGWLRDGGDLRVAHFFATHAMHVIPAFALALSLAGFRLATRAVMVFSVAYAVFVALVFAQALAGRPFLGFSG